MSVIDSTNVVESSMLLKSKMNKNFKEDNYYTQMLQAKLDRDWEYRYNVVDIEEENEKQLIYTKDNPEYTSVEAVIQSVLPEKGDKLSDDWRNLVFKNIKHPKFLGKRFRFAYDFERFIGLSEEEKTNDGSVWLTVNYNTTSPTNGCVIRRCNTNVVFTGSPTLEHNNTTEYHREPCIVENDFKNINTYYNTVINVASAELFLIMQYNYFTQFIQINDRFIIGDTDTKIKTNNYLFKAKTVNKFFSQSTFKVGTDIESSSVPLIVIGLEKDTDDSDDDLINRVADRCTVYQTVEKQIVEKSYNLKITEPYDKRIIQGETQIFECFLYNKNEKVENTDIFLNIDLLGTEVDNNYFTLNIVDGNHFAITNKKMYSKSNLSMEFYWVDLNNNKISKTIEIELGGFY